MSVLLFDDPAARGFTRAGDDVGKTSADLRWLRGDWLSRAELRLEHHFSQSVGEHFLLTSGSALSALRRTRRDVALAPRRLLEQGFFVPFFGGAQRRHFYTSAHTSRLHMTHIITLLAKTRARSARVTATSSQVLCQ